MCDLKKLDRIIPIPGIDNHKIDFILLLTAGDTAKTVISEVIVIVNQCAYLRKDKTNYFAD